MKKSDIKVGGLYLAVVNGQTVTVRVEQVKQLDKRLHPADASYLVTNLASGRRLTFASAERFAGPAVIDDEKPLARPKSASPPAPKTSPSREPAAEPDRAVVCEDCDHENYVAGWARRYVCDGCGVESDVPAAAPASPALTGPYGTKPPAVTPAAKAPAAKAPAAKAQPTADDVAVMLLDEERAAEAARAAADPPHLIIEARAGAGKTTTLVEGLRLVKGGRPTLTPSPQQAAVWAAMAAGRENVNTVCMVAFNKSIAEELQRRVPAGCDAMTMHSMGYKAVLRAYPGTRVNQYRVYDILSEHGLLGCDPRHVRRDYPVLAAGVDDLVALCKQNLADGNDRGELMRLVAHYDLELNGTRDRVFELVPRVLERCRDVARCGCVDFNDMVWLPVALDLPMTRYDLLLVDESQDLNRCQQALAKKAGRRLVLCGDPKQAIYGFAGADAESMARMARELGFDPEAPVTTKPCRDSRGHEWVLDRGTSACRRCGTTELEASKAGGPGCVTLPLTVTRRCGKAIVAEAKKIVPDFEAHEGNGEGKVGEARYPVQGGGRTGRPAEELPYEQTYMPLAEDGDMVLCRVNAPLVSQCFRFLKRGRKATIRGRDVGAGIVKLIKKARAATVPQLVAWVEDWAADETRKEQAKRNPSEARLISIGDKADCIMCFTEGASTVEEVVARVDRIFTDDKNVAGIKLSSIHKAKGLEARRVFFLRPETGPCPHPMAKSAWQQEQELHLCYVAITRAIEELVYVY